MSQQAFEIAVLTGDPPLRAQLVQSLARELDGNDALAALPGPWARLRCRLLVKWRELQWWRPRQPADPWDAGCVIPDTGGLAALARFQPRRATLIVADRLPAQALQQAIAALKRNSAGFGHPVRLLVLADQLPDGLADSTTVPLFDLPAAAR